MDTIYVGLALIGLFTVLRAMTWVRRRNDELNLAMMPNGLHKNGNSERVRFGHRWFLDSDDEWHTISCSLDGYSLDFYLDGVLLPTYICMDPDKKHDRELSISIKVERKEVPHA